MKRKPKVKMKRVKVLGLIFGEDQFFWPTLREQTLGACFSNQAVKHFKATSIGNSSFVMKCALHLGNNLQLTASIRCVLVATIFMEISKVHQMLQNIAGMVDFLYVVSIMD